MTDPFPAGSGRRIRSLGAWLLLSAVLAPLPVAGQDTLQTRIRQSQERLQEIRGERERLQQEMDVLQGQARNITRELANIELQAEASSLALQELDYQTAALAASAEGINRRLIQTRDRLQERNVVMRLRLRSIYKRGPLHTVRVLLSAESFGDLLNRYKYLQLMAVHDQLLVNEISALEQELSEQEATLTRNLAQMERLREEQLSEFARLQFLEQSRARTLEVVQGQVSQAGVRIRQLEEDERRLAGIMEQLEEARLAAERRRAAAGLAGGAGNLTADVLGQLPWPVDGEILYQFGPERRPNGVTLRRNGLGISAAPGTPVRAIRGGTVMVADVMEGFGNGVVIDHGAGYYTLYLYLGEVRVQEGQDVVTGNVLGTVGTGPEEGPHLYLQLRAPVSGGAPVPVDPFPWLRSR